MADNNSVTENEIQQATGRQLPSLAKNPNMELYNETTIHKMSEVENSPDIKNQTKKCKTLKKCTVKCDICPFTTNTVELLNRDACSHGTLMKGIVTEHRVLSCLKAPSGVRPQIMVKHQMSPVFDPPVNLGDLETTHQMKQVLLQTLKNLKSSADKHEDIIAETKEDNERKSKQLLDIIDDFLNVLAKFGNDVSMLHLPDQMNEMIHKHKTNLQQKSSEPFLVVGEISSGKSTLLNILIKENHLPTRFTSCTSRMSEIRYSENQTSELSQMKEGKTVVTIIPPDQLNNELQLGTCVDRLDNDVVKIGLPAIFLKSGITLVDSPGWGNNEEDNNVVLQYSNSEENDLSGLICTFNCSAGGGITDMFKKQLHKIVEAKQKNGERKLNPQMILFVATWWDGVNDQEKEETRDHVIKLIKELPFMETFESDTQLFFVSGKHILSNIQAGVIDEELKGIFKGIQTVLQRSHTNKLEEAYKYIEARVEDALRCILYMERMSLKEQEKDSLDEVLFKADAAIQRILNEYQSVDNVLQEQFEKVYVNKLSKKIQKYFEGRKSEMSNWKVQDLACVLKSEEEPEAITRRISDLIRERMFEMLLGFEIQHHFITTLKSKIVQVYFHIRKVAHNQLSKIERSIRCNESSDTVNYHIEEMVTYFKQALSFLEEFGSDESPKRAINLNSKDKKGGLVVYVPQGVTMFLETLFNTDEKLPSKESKTYENELVEYTGKLAKAFCKQICKFKNVNMFLKRQLQMETIRKNNMESIEERVQHNMKSISDLKQYSKLPRKVISVEQLKVILDRLLNFKFHHLINSYFPQIKLQADGKKWLFCGLFGSIQMKEVEGGSKKVTVKKLINTNGSPLRYSDASTLIQTLRSIKAPCFLGDYNFCTGLVFEGHLYTAREHFMKQVSKQPEGIYMKLVKDFLRELAETLQALHLENFLHTEVSLDSILVKIDPSEGLPRPVLTNLNERKPIDFALDALLTKVKNMIYLPPEVISGYGKTPIPMANWYKAPGDVYGMGLFMLELLFRKYDIFEEEKAKTLAEWIYIPDHRKHLVTVAEESSCAKIPDNWRSIIEICVDKDPQERIPMLSILKHLEELERMSYHKATERMI